MAHLLSHRDPTDRGPADDPDGATRRGMSAGFDSALTALDHIGVAVTSIEGALAAYRAILGMGPSGTEDIAAEGVRVAFLPFPGGGGSIELLEPTRPDSPVGKFLGRNGPGIHHLSFRVPSCREAIRAARAAGIRVLPPAPRTGAGGVLVAFFHPKDTGGVLIEVAELSGGGPEGGVAEAPQG